MILYMFDLYIVKDFFNKIINNENISIDDIKQLIFDENFKMPKDFIASEDFTEIINAFNFNGDNKVNIEDFQYLKNHIQDLNTILKLIKFSI